MTATAYTQADALGPAGPPLQVTLQVTDSPGGPAVTSLTLINADTEQPIAGFNPLPATAPLNLATLPTQT